MHSLGQKALSTAIIQFIVIKQCGGGVPLLLRHLPVFFRIKILVAKEACLKM